MKKMDLHIHTVSTKRDKPFAFSIEKLKGYVIQEKVDLIAITNHNLFDAQQFSDITNGLSTDALFVDNEVNKGGNRLENYARALERSKRMMQIIDTAIDLMRRKHKKGEFYYWILYYAYLSPQQCENAGAILQALESKGISISLRTYYVHRDEAIEVLSSILWGYTSQDCEKITNLLTPD